MAFRKETFFFFVCINVPHHVDKNALMFHECTGIGMNVNIEQSPCLHSCDQVVCLADCLTSSNNLPNISELECEQDRVYFLNKLLVATWRSCELFPFCTGKLIVLANICNFA